MNRSHVRSLSRFGAMALLIAVGAPAQNRPALDNRLNAQSFGLPLDTALSFRVETRDAALAGTQAYVLLSFNQTPSNVWGYDVGLTPDALTGLQISAGFAGSIGGFVFQNAGLLDSTGGTTMSVSVPSGAGIPVGTPIFLTPVIMASGATPTVVASATVTGPFVPGGTGPGGQYLGPGDTAPPVPSTPLGGGTANPCNGPMTQATDTLSALGVPQIFVPTVWSGPVQFGCAQNVGEAGEVTLTQLMFGLAQQGGLTATHVDFVWYSTFPMRDMRIYPVKALQQAAVDWLALHPDKINAASNRDAIQVCDPNCPTDVHGTPQPPIFDEFGLLRGFFAPPCDANRFERAHGQGRACVRDDCACGETLYGIRLRVRLDCLLTKISAINTANPNKIVGNSVLFAFVGEWCNSVQ